MGLRGGIAKRTQFYSSRRGKLVETKPKTNPIAGGVVDWQNGLSEGKTEPESRCGPHTTSIHGGTTEILRYAQNDAFWGVNVSRGLLVCARFRYEVG